MTGLSRDAVAERVASGLADIPTTLSSRSDGQSDDRGRAGVSGKEVARPSCHAGFADVLETHTVFGRVTRAQKRQMIPAMQSRRHIVAMTGDGANDALALKVADIGIAMNNATQATRAVSRLALLDDRVDRLPSVVAEGRQVITNIERVFLLFPAKTAYSVVQSVAFGALLWGFPFLSRQLSVIDGLTFGLPQAIPLIRNSGRDHRCDRDCGSTYLRRCHTRPHRRRAGERPAPSRSPGRCHHRRVPAGGQTVAPRRSSSTAAVACHTTKLSTTSDSRPSGSSQLPMSSVAPGIPTVRFTMKASRMARPRPIAAA